MRTWGLFNTSPGSKLLACTEHRQLTSAHPCSRALCPSSRLHSVTFSALCSSSTAEEKSKRHLIGSLGPCGEVRKWRMPTGQLHKT